MRDDLGEVAVVGRRDRELALVAGPALERTAHALELDRAAEALPLADDLARRAEPVALRTVPVTVRALHRTGTDGDLVSVFVSASAGFYVRALARDLGQALGCGAHLESLRRTKVGRFDVAQALRLDEAEIRPSG